MFRNIQSTLWKEKLKQAQGWARKYSKAANKADEYRK